MRQEVLDGIEYARSSEGRAAVELRRIKLLDNGCVAALPPLPPASLSVCTIVSHRTPLRAHHLVASHSRSEGGPRGGTPRSGGPSPSHFL